MDHSKKTESSQLSVVVVDDSPTSRKCTTDALATGGFQIAAVACDGEEALQAVAQHQPHVVVLDIILPKKSGFQVCREIKANVATNQTKVLLLSSKNREADRFWGLSQGADAYLAKPFDSRELISIARAVVDPAAFRSEHESISHC